MLSPWQQVRIAVGVDVEPLGAEQVLVRTGGEFFTGADRESRRELFCGAPLEEDTAADDGFPALVFGGLA